MEYMLNSREKLESKLYAVIAGIFSFFLVIQARYTVNVISVEGTPNTSIVAEIVNLIYMLVFTIALFVAKSKIPFVALTGFSLIYNFANIVDDHLMHTTHVIRGDEWLSSLPYHLELFHLVLF